MDCLLAVLKGTLFSILDCFSCSLSSLWQNQGTQSCTRSVGGHWDKRVDLRCEDKLCFQRQFRGELKQQEAIYQHIVYYRLWAKNFKSWMDLFLASNLGQGPGANKMKTIISLQHNDKLHIIHCLWYVSWLQRPAILQQRRQLHKYLHFSAVLWKGILFCVLMEKKGQDYSRTWVCLISEKNELL